MWTDVLDQPLVDRLVVQVRRQGLIGATAIRAVIERLAEQERRKRAAVRALAYIRAQAPMYIGGEPHTVSAGGFYKADAVLATDTAKQWLREEQDG